MTADRGFLLIEIVVTLSVVGLIVAICLPAWWSIFKTTTQLYDRIRQVQQIDWVVQRVCDDYRFKTPNTIYQYDGSKLRRIVGGTTQILNTEPIVGWHPPSTGNAYMLKIETNAIVRSCDCRPWQSEP